jgi:hypothetical protein
MQQRDAREQVGRGPVRSQEAKGLKAQNREKRVTHGTPERYDGLNADVRRRRRGSVRAQEKQKKAKHVT